GEETTTRQDEVIKQEDAVPHPHDVPDSGALDAINTETNKNNVLQATLSDVLRNRDRAFVLPSDSTVLYINPSASQTEDRGA
ncbi:unnamed protein product, partial [Amoebophrya sp. A25]